jgi:hypothetical protein
VEIKYESSDNVVECKFIATTEKRLFKWNRIRQLIRYQELMTVRNVNLKMDFNRNWQWGSTQLSSKFNSGS